MTKQSSYIYQFHQFHQPQQLPYPFLSQLSLYIYQPHQTKEPQKDPFQSKQFPQQILYLTHQPAPPLVSNLVSNSFNSKIQKDCKCIPKYSRAVAFLALIFLAQTFSIKKVSLALVFLLAQTSLVQILLILSALIQALLSIFLKLLPFDELNRVNIISQLSLLTPLTPVQHGYKNPKKLPKHVNKFDTLTNKNTKIVKLFEKYVFKVVISNKAVTPKEVRPSTEVFESGFVNEIKNPGIHKAYNKCYLVLQASND